MNNKIANVLIAGDFCPIGRTGKTILEGKTKSMVSDIQKYISNADVSVVNLEVPLTDRGEPIPKTGPNLIADPRCIEFLNESGFNLINTANNHILDYGDEGLFQTLDLIKDNKLTQVGSGKNLEEAAKPAEFKTPVGKVQFLAFAENEYTTATKYTAGACPIEIHHNTTSIRKARQKGDFVIVMVHGGNEYMPVPSPGMKSRYRCYIDAGADAVVAMHTHCPQGYELYNSKPIVYSLGNFLFDTPYPDRVYKDDDFWWKGYMVNLTLLKNKNPKIEVIPVNAGPDATKVREMKESEKTTFIKYLEHISDLLKDEDESLKYWKAWCLMKGDWWGDYIGKITYPIDRSDKGSLLNAFIMRNGLSCEAHNEILTTFWKMTAHDDVHGYDDYISKIESLQKGVITD